MGRFYDSRFKPSEASFSDVDNFRPEVGSDVMFGAVVNMIGVKVVVKFGGSRSKRSRDIRLLLTL